MSRKYRVRECDWSRGQYYAEVKDGFFSDWRSCYKVSSSGGISRYGRPAMKYPSVSEAEKAIEEYEQKQKSYENREESKTSPYQKEYTLKG